MELVKKNILLISPESWEHIFVSKHHYATHLGERGNKVYFLNPPTSTFKNEKTTYKNVFNIHYTGFSKGLRYYPAFIQRFFIRKVFNELQKKLDVTFDIVWSFDNSVFYDFKALPKSILKISHIVDLNQNFQTAKATQTANICFGVTHSIIDRLKQYNKHSYFINHGYNSNTKSDTIKIKIPGKHKIKALYAGNLSIGYLDWESLFYISKNNQEINFIFIGPHADNFTLNKNTTHNFKQRFTQLSNAHFVGKLESKVLQKWYHSADILLISYQEQNHIDQANPHKMMEYLSSGKVIVGTKTLEYQKLAKQGIIAMADKNEELPHLFKEVAINLEQWNSDELSQKRKDFAMGNTYDKQIERIEGLLNKHDINYNRSLNS